MMMQLPILSLTQVQHLKLWQLQVSLFPILQLQGQALSQQQWLHPPQCQLMTMPWLTPSLTRAPPLLPFSPRGSLSHTNPHTLLQLLLTPPILSPPHKLTQRPHPPNTVLPSTASTRRPDNLTRRILSQPRQQLTSQATQSTSPPAAYLSSNTI